MLDFFSISKGLWENFKQLWLQDNNLNVTTISQILSIASICCVIALIIFSKKLSLNKIKKVISVSILIKGLCLLALYILNQSEYIMLIKILVVLDTIFEKIIIISIYPFIVTIKKDNKLYSKRKLVEYLFCDIGILIGGIIIGKTIMNIIVCFIAITWSILISTAYENITDAPYINRVENKYQMVFTNVRYIVGLIGTSIGLYFAGVTYNMGINYMLGISAFFMIFQIGVAYYLIYLRKKNNKE